MNLMRRDQWIYAMLWQLSDPLKSADAAPQTAISPGVLRRMLAIARIQGVLGIVTQKLAGQAPHAPDVWEAAQRCWRAETVQSIRIRQHTKILMRAFAQANIPAVAIKGIDFVDHLYPNPRLRPTMDVDVIVPREAWQQATQVLESTGHEEKRDQPPMEFFTGTLGERSWVWRTAPRVEIDLHWNLINFPTLRRRSSMEFKDLDWERSHTPEGPALKATPATRLVIAASHAFHHHQFDHLLLLVDLQQACRGITNPAAVTAIGAMIDRTQIRPAVDASLAVAAAFLKDSHIDSIRREIARTSRGNPPAEIPPYVLQDARKSLCTIRNHFNAPHRLRLRNWLRAVT